MKKKELIAISLVSISLFTTGCSQKSVELENAEKMAKANVTLDSGTQYRQRLHLLKKFKSKIVLPFINNEGWQNGKCKKVGYDKETFKLCTERESIEIIKENNTCKDEIKGLKQGVTFVEVQDDGKTKTTRYKCVNKDEGIEKKVPQHYINEDIRYISVYPIVNKSGKKDLPTNLDLIVKNTLNTVGENYILIEATKNPKNGEYRIEGAITGLDTTYNQNNNIGGQLYQTGGARGNLDANHNSNSNITELSMDFIISKYDSRLKKWKYLENVSTSKQIKLLKIDKSNNFIFGLLGGGIRLGNMISKSNGISHISRALIESSLIELLAKIDDLPYWSFLPNTFKYYTYAEANWKNQLLDVYKKRLREDVLKKYYTEHFVPQLLSSYYGDDDNDNVLKERIERYKKENIERFRGNYNGKVDENLIVDLLERVPNKLVTAITPSQELKPKDGLSNGEQKAKDGFFYKGESK